jgi:hypothetical protein
MKSRELWLTSLTQSNDSQEGLWMLNYWLEKFDRRVPEKRLLRNAAKVLFEGTLHQNTALGVCFSEERDLLSQWRGYASDGGGFSVSFDFQKLSEQVDGSQIELKKIAYGNQDYDEVNNVIKELADAYLEDAKGYQESSDGIGHLSLNNAGQKMEKYRKAARLLFSIKNGAFSEEKEWRLFAFDELNKMSGVQYRVSGNTISPYMLLKLPREAIAGVTLGPTNPTPESVIEDSLKHFGIKGFVHRSLASYRS